MAIVNLTATKLSNLSVMDSPQVKTMHGLNIHSWTVEVGSADSDTSTYLIAHLPSNCRIHDTSWIGYDDMASTGAPTLDIGTFNVTGGSDDVDAINDGLTVATAARSVGFLKLLADHGKYLWDLAGESSDPGGFIDIKLTLDDADVNVGGTAAGEIFYSME